MITLNTKLSTDKLDVHTVHKQEKLQTEQSRLSPQKVQEDEIASVNWPERLSPKHTTLN